MESLKPEPPHVKDETSSSSSINTTTDTRNVKIEAAEESHRAVLDIKGALAPKESYYVDLPASLYKNLIDLISETLRTDCTLMRTVVIAKLHFTAFRPPELGKEQQKQVLVLQPGGQPQIKTYELYKNFIDMQLLQHPQLLMPVDGCINALKFYRYVDTNGNWIWVLPSRNDNVKKNPRFIYDVGKVYSLSEQKLPKLLEDCDLYKAVRQAVALNVAAGKLEITKKYRADQMLKASTSGKVAGIYVFIIWDVLSECYRGYVGQMNDFHIRCGSSYRSNVRSHNSAQAKCIYGYDRVSGFIGSEPLFCDWVMAATGLDYRIMPVQRFTGIINPEVEWRSWFFILEEANLAELNKKELYWIDRLHTRFPDGLNEK